MELILNEYVKNKNIKLNKIKMRLIYAYPYLINNDRVVKRLYKLKKDFSKSFNLFTMNITIFIFVLLRKNLDILQQIVMDISYINQTLKIVLIVHLKILVQIVKIIKKL